MNDGGPAFPRPTGFGSNDQEGMSLRDWFAGQAMVGMLAAGCSWDVWEHASKKVYLIADEMLKAREVEK